MADNYVSDFRINSIAYDRQAKEVVKLTNFKCVLAHDNPSVFKESHVRVDGTCGCLMAPCEAMAIRLVGFDGQGRARLAYTYRAVVPAMLSPCRATAWPDLDKMKPKANFIGRV